MLDQNSKIAVVCRGGPENGPFSAKAFTTLSKGLVQNGLKISGVYAVSGSVTTALLGAIGEEERLCRLWSNLTPKDIVGTVSKLRSSINTLSRESVLSSQALENLIRENFGERSLNKFFSSEAMMAKIAATDYLTRKLIIFCNRNPKHREWIYEGIMGSKALVPFFPPKMVYEPVKAELIDETEFDALMLIDSAFKTNLLLEEAMMDGYDYIFVVDIHNLETSNVDVKEKYFWPNLLRGATHILINSNDYAEMRIVERINEEISAKNQIEEVLEMRDKLPPEAVTILEATLKRMNEGRLRLHDKRLTSVVMVSARERSMLFNFIKFAQTEVASLMEAGHYAAIRTLNNLGLNTKGL